MNKRNARNLEGTSQASVREGKDCPWKAVATWGEFWHLTMCVAGVQQNTLARKKGLWVS